MVTGTSSDAQARPPSSLPLPVGQRHVVTALSSLLPAGFRARQRAEWAATCSHSRTVPPACAGGTSWAPRPARTLPALRAAAGRNRCADPPSLPITLGPGAAALTSLARVLLVGLGWPAVRGRLLWVPGRYYLYDIPGTIARTGAPVDPKDLLPDSPLIYLALPVVLPLQFGALVALFGGMLMVMSVALAAIVVGVAQRRRSARHRLILSVAGIVAILSVLGGMGLGFGSPSGG